MAVDPNMEKASLAADGLTSELNNVASEAKKFATTMNAINEKIKKTANLTQEELEAAGNDIGRMRRDAATLGQAFKRGTVLLNGLFDGIKVTDQTAIALFNKNAIRVGSNFNTFAARLQSMQNTLANTTNEFNNVRKGMGTVGTAFLYTRTALFSVGQAFTQLRTAVFGLQKQVGTTFGSALNVGVGAFTNQITSFFSGGPPLTFQESVDAINAFQREFGGILTRGEAQKIAQASKALGISSATFLQAQRSFLVVGGEATKNTFIGQFRAAGLTAANALEFAAKNANLVAIAGTKYAAALAQAAANAQRIGVGLDRTEALADGIVGNFEGALERFSELRAMGVEVDFNRLAAVAGTGTPQEVLSELQSQLGGNQQLLAELQRNRFLKVALEQDLGLNVAEITRLAAGGGAVATEQTQEEKDRTTRDKILERVGTVANFLAALIAVIPAQTVATVSNTKALLARKVLGVAEKPQIAPTTAQTSLPRQQERLALPAPKSDRTFYQGGQTPPIPGRPGIPAGRVPPATTSGVRGLLPASTTAVAGQTQQQLQNQLSVRLAETTRIAANLQSQGLSTAAAAQKALAIQASQPGTVALAASMRQSNPDMPASQALALARGQSAIPTQQIATTSTQMTRAVAAPTVAAGGGMFGNAMAGAGGGAAVTGAGVLGGAVAGISEFQQTKSIKRAIAATLIGIVTSVLATLLIGMIPGAQLVAPIVGGMIGSAVTPMLTSFFMGSAKAAGGLITGPGTATSDNILTPTSPGEYVVNAKATKAYGADMLDNINKGTFTPTQTPSVNNVVNVNMDKMEAKLDKLAAAFSNMKIDMDGNTVGRVSLNARSPLDRLAVVG